MVTAQQLAREHHKPLKAGVADVRSQADGTALPAEKLRSFRVQSAYKFDSIAVVESR
jgi:hypothetical protein